MKTTLSLVFKLALPLAAAALPARALDITGKVVNRFWVGVADAKVCAQGGSPCVQSAADGSFRILGPVSLRRSPRVAEGFALRSASGGLALHSPRGLSARFEWLDASGARLARPASADLSVGANPLAAPAARGLCILRVTSPGLALVWTLGPDGVPGAATPVDLDAGGAPEHHDPAPEGRGPLAKVSAPLPLVATKAGFSAAGYSPGAEVEAGVSILLSPEGENTVQLFNGRSFDGWDQSAKAIGGAPGSWIMQDGAFHSVGSIRGTLSTKQDFGSFRILFTLRHLPSTGSDHQPCVVIWGSRPPPNDALGGIQFQPPNGGHWDYRPGKNNSGGGLFTKVSHTAIDRAKWAQCEIWAKQATGEARMACCNLGEAGPCKGQEVLKFKDASAGKQGPLGLQIHNSGLHDQYKNISLEIDPKVEDLITTKI